MELSGPQTRVLAALARHYMLSNDHIRRVLQYSPASAKYIIKLTHSLHQERYVFRDKQPSKTPMGIPYFYLLSGRGQDYLDARGILSLHTVRDRNGERDLSRGYIDHTWAIADISVAAELAAGTGKVAISRQLHERELKHLAAKVKYKGEEIYVSPDLWIEFDFPDGTQSAVSFEVDMGTEHVSRWRQKVRGILSWTEGPYQKLFETQSLTVAVWANSPHRALQLRHWTELELKAQDKKSSAPLFLFTAQNPNDNPEYFYFGSHWRHPFDETLRPLLEVE